MWSLFILGKRNWFTYQKYSHPMKQRHSKDKKKWSQHVMCLYWTPFQPYDFGDEGSRTRKWSNYYAEYEAGQLGPNRGVRSAIANQPVARSKIEVCQDWWYVQELVTIPQFLSGLRAHWRWKTNQTKQPWRWWTQHAAYEESDRNSKSVVTLSNMTILRSWISIYYN
jgi:hypothetical protein